MPQDADAPVLGFGSSTLLSDTGEGSGVSVGERRKAEALGTEPKERDGSRRSHVAVAVLAQVLRQQRRER